MRWRRSPGFSSTRTPNATPRCCSILVCESVRRCHHGAAGNCSLSTVYATRGCRRPQPAVLAAVLPRICPGYSAPDVVDAREYIEAIGALPPRRECEFTFGGPRYPPLTTPSGITSWRSALRKVGETAR